jgi:hypothetical protein
MQQYSPDAEGPTCAHRNPISFSPKIHPNAYAVSSYGIRIGEVRIWSPTPAMIIAGVTASPPVM